jgi:hypothetical protein
VQLAWQLSPWELQFQSVLCLFLLFSQSLATTGQHPGLISKSVLLLLLDSAMGSVALLWWQGWGMLCRRVLMHGKARKLPQLRWW